MTDTSAPYRVLRSEFLKEPAKFVAMSSDRSVHVIDDETGKILGRVPGPSSSPRETPVSRQETEAAQKKPYIKVARPDLGSSYIEEPSKVPFQLQHELEEMVLGGESDDRLVLSVVEMSEEEFKSLSEFTGW